MDGKAISLETKPLGVVGGGPETSSGRDLQNCIILRIGENGVADRLIGCRNARRTLADLVEPGSPSTIIDLVSERREDEATPLFRQRSIAVETAKLLEQPSVRSRMHDDPRWYEAMMK
jgi:hypothetical protein